MIAALQVNGPLHPVQMAYHVPDPAAAAERLAREFGWGPFFLLEHIPLESCVFRGRSARFDHTSAYGQGGELMIELITQHDDEPSVLRDMYSAAQCGLHHVAYFVSDLPRAIEQFTELQYEIALDATTAGVRFVMVDARAQLGHMLELYQPGAQLKRFYEFVRRKSLGWDGTEPLRRLVPR